MRKLLPIFFIALFLLCIPRGFTHDLSSQYLTDLGKEAFTDGNYADALKYFQSAQEIDPDSKELIYYINLIKRISEDRVTVVREQSSLDSALNAAEGQVSVSPAMVSSGSKRQVIDETLDYIEGKSKPRQVQSSGGNVSESTASTSSSSSSSSNNTPIIQRQTRPTAQAVEKVVELKPENEKNFPLDVEIFPNQSFIVRAGRIRRYLAVTEGFVHVDRLDESSIRVSGVALGPTIFYVWDDNNTRWIFKLQVEPLSRMDMVQKAWEESGGFKFFYDNDWRSYYKGPKWNTLDRNTVLFDQDAGFSGSTPYGDFDNSFNWSNIGNHPALKGYTVGLSNGHFVYFNGFNVRGFDFTNAFSPLSFPGTTLRGIYFNSPMFNHLLEYTYVEGSDRRSYGYLSSGLTTSEKSYIEGVQAKLFPLGKNTIIFNYARGYGPDRESYLKDEVYSIESRHTLGNLGILNEFAYDGERTASTSAWTLHLPKTVVRMSFRDIDKEFLTISGRPAGSAEVGGILGLDWRPNDRFYVTSDTDIYRDRQNFNPGKFDALNYDWNGSTGYNITPTLAWTNNAYYSDTAQLSFPQRSLSATSTLTKSSKIDVLGHHTFTVYSGYTYQHSQNVLSPASDYHRDSVFVGSRLSLIKNLYAYGTYTYSWLDELQTGTRSNPSVLEAGAEYNKDLTGTISSNYRVYYRKESDAASVHSFLAGENSLEESMSLSYRPTRDVQFFADARVREVWPHTTDSANYIEADVRLGTKIQWDSFFKWSPSVVVEGCVFKDLNGNGKRDPGEEPIAGARINVGPHTVITDKNGKYRAVVRAKTVTAILDINSISKGYVLTTANSVRIDTSRAGRHIVDFGVSSQSGLYGIVFYDANGNGKFDKDDKPIAKARLMLNGKQIAMTNNDGVYFFNGLKAGTYTISLDVNSIPLQYLPAVAIRQQIEVKEGVTSAYHIPLSKR